jgi:hypothetical protein
MIAAPPARRFPGEVPAGWRAVAWNLLPMATRESRC